MDDEAMAAENALTSKKFYIFQSFFFAVIVGALWIVTFAGLGVNLVVPTLVAGIVLLILTFVGIGLSRREARRKLLQRLAALA